MTMMMGMMGMIRIVWSLAKLAPSPLPHKIPRKNRGQKWPENTAQCGSHHHDEDDGGGDGGDGGDLGWDKINVMW